MRNRLKELRKEKGLTLQEVAKILEVDTSMVGYIERGERTFSPDTLIRAAVYFNVSTDYLLGYADENAKETIATLKHRAEVAERALEILAKNESVCKYPKNNDKCDRTGKDCYACALKFAKEKAEEEIKKEIER